MRHGHSAIGLRAGTSARPSSTEASDEVPPVVVHEDARG